MYFSVRMSRPSSCPYEYVPLLQICSWLRQRSSRCINGSAKIRRTTTPRPSGQTGARYYCVDERSMSSGQRPATHRRADGIIPIEWYSCSCISQSLGLKSRKIGTLVLSFLILHLYSCRELSAYSMWPPCRSLLLWFGAFSFYGFPFHVQLVDGIGHWCYLQYMKDGVMILRFVLLEVLSLLRVILQACYLFSSWYQMTP